MFIDDLLKKGLPDDVMVKIIRNCYKNARAQQVSLVPELDYAPSSWTFGDKSVYPFEADGVVYNVSHAYGYSYSIKHVATCRNVLQCYAFPDHVALMTSGMMSPCHIDRIETLMTALFRIMARNGVILDKTTVFRLSGSTPLGTHVGVKNIINTILVECAHDEPTSDFAQWC